jgi:UDPglucose--hexose-1-phosphate uridylyltransferase
MKVMPSELRKHYFLDQYVVISPKRALRPHDLGIRESTHKAETPTSPAIEDDPAVFQVPDGHGGWHVKVINNKFPALSLTNPKAYGKQEVVIETPEHNVEFSQLPLMQIERIFAAYRQRTMTLRKLPDIRHVTVFKNDGPLAGASIAHAHSQIIALPVVPPLLATESAMMQSYYDEYGTCAYCDAIAWEIKHKKRVVYNDGHIIAWTPFASQFSFECWFAPQREVATFAELTGEELQGLAKALKKVTMALDEANLSFNFYLQDSLVGTSHHFVLKLEPRSGSWAGFELSTGIIINPVSPEAAAAWYRRQK